MMKSAFKSFGLVVALLAAGACASSRNLDRTFSDLGVNAELKTVLFSDRNHDYSDVDLTIYEGRLLLTGTMHREAGRQSLIDNAWKAGGVKQVIDEIIIGEQTRMGQGFADTRIDQTLRAKLIADKNVHSGDYKITVSKGVVYLLGAAASQEEIRHAVGRARTIAGVEKVVSYVDIRAPLRR